RRALGRAVAAAGRADDRHDPRAEARIRSHRTHGRAELPPGDPHRRPRLHHRAWRDRVRRRNGRRARAESAGEALLPGNELKDQSLRYLSGGLFGAGMGLSGLVLSARAAATALPGIVRAPAYFTEPWAALGALAFVLLF